VCPGPESHIYPWAKGDEGVARGRLLSEVTNRSLKRSLSSKDRDNGGTGGANTNIRQ